MTLLSGGSFQIASEGETKTFLTTISVESQDAARTLWDTYSGRRGMLDARKKGESKRGYSYDPDLRRFVRNTDGQVVGDNDIEKSVRRVSNGARNEMRKQTQQLIAGSIVLAVYYSRMRSIMNALYSAIWLVSIGGFVFEDNTTRNLFYLWVLSQYRFFDRFADDLERGTASLDGRSVVRSGMYGEAGNGLWQNIILEQKQKDGFDEAKRVLGDNENHCEDSDDRSGCIELALQGWIPIQSMTPIGNATCLTNCHCAIEYRRLKK
jgi:hypothetical protein